jgi:hypothetical protein
MKTLVWFLLSLCLAIWSGLCWFAYQAIGIGGRFAARNADAIGPDAEAIEMVSNWALWGASFGEWAVIGVWGVGVVVALLFGWLANSLVRVAKDKIDNRPTQPPAI